MKSKVREKARTKQKQQVWKARDRKPAPQESYHVEENVRPDGNNIQTPTQLLDHYLESKGIQYILEAIREKETRSSLMQDHAIVERTANEIIQAVKDALFNSLQVSSPIESFQTNSQSDKKPDMDRLKGLL